MRRACPPWIRRAAVLAAAAGFAVVAALGCAPVAPPATTVPQPAPPSVELVLRLGERRLYLHDADPATTVESFPIAIGRDGHETPPGRYKVEEKVEYPEYLKVDPTDRARVLERVPPGPANPLGDRWIGIILGDGWTIGIHGTPRPELLGQAVSRGCIRMRNADVVRIYDRVELGTPVTIEP